MARELKLEDLQSFDDSAFGIQLRNKNMPEQRRSRRSAFETSASLEINDLVLEITTIDISAGGLSAFSPRQVGVGMEGLLGFQLPVDGENYAVSMRVRVIYCFHSGEHLYKIGMAILALTCGKEAFEHYLALKGEA